MRKLKREPFFNADDVLTHVTSALQSCRNDLLAYNQFDAPTSTLLNAQVDSFAKKYVPVNFCGDQMSLDAYLLFEQVNESMANVNTYPYPTGINGSRLGIDQKVLLRARNLIASVLGSFDEDEFFLNCKNSSGTTIGCTYSNSSPEAKFRNMTYTEGVERWFSYYLSYDPQLKRELAEFPHEYTKVTGSRAVTVPKDSKKVRMICVEPMLNMFFQQGLMQCLASRLERVGLSFESQQEVNRHQAWKASITGRFSTIDWSSASDTLSKTLIQFLFPQDWYYHLSQFRCEYMEVLGGYMELHMFSTMGNACTFPIETLVFWALACACDSISDGLTSTHIDPSLFKERIFVFGDDCIVPIQSSAFFLEFMSRFGFRPNLDKTFLEGRFRESCGGDFFAGQDVRPYFLTGPQGNSKLHLTAWLNIIFNRLQNRFIRICGPLKYVYSAHKVFDALFSLFRKYGCNIHIVPTYFPDDAGIKCGADLFRFLRYYRIRDLIPEIRKDQHGTIRFKYLCAHYPVRTSISESIRLWMAIKGVSLRKPSFFLIKRRHSYVTARGVSCCFSVNFDGKH